MHANSEQLAAQFPVPGLSFATAADGLVKATVATGLSTGELYLQGAHVTSFVPNGKLPVLWMSRSSHFEPGKPIRGGVPICFPWFGPHASDPNASAHGPARIALWQLTDAQLLESGAIALTLRVEIDGFQVHYQVTFGQDLQLNLQVQLPNTATHPLRFEEALHSYFAVADIHRVAIEGLEQASFIDKVDGAVEQPPEGKPIHFDRECDRVYMNTTATCKVIDHVHQRCIVVSKTNSDSTVVWNPWIAKSARMADFGDDEWQGMVCVESANVGTNAILLEPGKTHELAVVISVQ